jgi:DNA repair protein RadC
MYKLFDARTPPDALMYYGAEKLSDAELLAVLTGKDAQGERNFLPLTARFAKRKAAPRIWRIAYPRSLCGISE